jgi:cobalt-zinc-cadmium resistance protein CzcA
VVVRFPEAACRDIADLERLLIASPAGGRVQLAQIAKFTTIEAPAQISRENGMRRVVAEVNIRGRDLGGFVSEVQGKLAPLVKGLPSGYYVEYGGQFENQQRAMRQLAIVVPMALLLIMVLLYMALGSVWHALLVLLNLPFALIGGVIAVVAFRMPLSVPRRSPSSSC